MRRLKKMRDEGVAEAHLFLASPAPLALLFGASVNAGPAMTLYDTSMGNTFGQFACRRRRRKPGPDSGRSVGMPAGVAASL